MNVWSSATYYAAKTRNSYMTDFQILSRRQVEMAYQIRLYRERHNITQTELAFRCSAFGKPFKVKFTSTDISNYERLVSIPREKKMNILLMAIGVTKTEIEGSKRK